MAYFQKRDNAWWAGFGAYVLLGTLIVGIISLILILSPQSMVEDTKREAIKSAACLAQSDVNFDDCIRSWKG